VPKRCEEADGTTAETAFLAALHGVTRPTKQRDGTLRQAT